MTPAMTLLTTVLSLGPPSALVHTLNGRCKTAAFSAVSVGEVGRVVVLRPALEMAAVLSVVEMVMVTAVKVVLVLQLAVTVVS